MLGEGSISLLQAAVDLQVGVVDALGGELGVERGGHRGEGLRGFVVGRSDHNRLSVIAAERCATRWAAGWGVVTTMTSARGRNCDIESATSPVPAGMSTTR